MEDRVLQKLLENIDANVSEVKSDVKEIRTIVARHDKEIALLQEADKSFNKMYDAYTSPSEVTNRVTASNIFNILWRVLEAGILAYLIAR